MKRTIAFLAPCILLAGCGGEEFADDFSVAVKRSPEAVYTELSRLSGDKLTRPLSLDPIERTRTGEREVTFSIPATEGDDGRLRFRVTEVEGGSSAVGVMLDLPTITRRKGISTEYLSEPKAQRALHEAMGRWADSFGMGSGATAEFAEIDLTLGALAIATQRFDKLGNTEALLADADFSELGGGEAPWSQPGEPLDAGAPMSDAAVDPTYGAPMDQAVGTDPAGSAEDSGGWGDAGS